MRNLYVDWLFLVPTGIFLAMVMRVAEWLTFVPRYTWQTEPEMSLSLLVPLGFVFILFFTRHQRKMRIAHEAYSDKPRTVAHMWGIFETVVLTVVILLGSLAAIDGVENAVYPEQYFTYSPSFNNIEPTEHPPIYPTATPALTATPRPIRTRIDTAATRQANAAALQPYVPATTTPAATPAESEPISITITHQHNQMGTITTDDPAVPVQE